MGRKLLRDKPNKRGKKTLVAYCDVEMAEYVYNFLDVIGGEVSGFVRKATLEKIERYLNENEGIRKEFEGKRKGS